MSRIDIKLVTPQTISLLEMALQQLAADMGDVYSTDQSTLATATCGPQAPCLALLACRENTLMGATLATPIFSTIMGGAGLYVSDLWVAPAARSQGLGRRLLADVMCEGTRRQMGRFLKLAVYKDNPKARAVYDQLGFAAQTDETGMILTGQPLIDLKESR